jgi:hypothetical protein
VLVPQQDGGLSTAVEAAQDFMAASRSKATLRAYRSDWHDFEKLCDRHCPGEPQLSNCNIEDIILPALSPGVSRLAESRETVTAEAGRRNNQSNQPINTFSPGLPGGGLKLHHFGSNRKPTNESVFVSLGNQCS